MRDFAQADQIVEVIRGHAARRPGQDAVTLVSGPQGDGEATSIDFETLDHRARRVAARLQAMHEPGDRVLLLYPTGLDFAVAFVACLYAGMVATPAPLPGRNAHQQNRIRCIATDASVVAILTDSANATAIAEWAQTQGLDHVPQVATDNLADLPPADRWCMPRLNRQTLALLQYTSGSTGDPKGVMVDQGNLLHNVDSLRGAYGLPPGTRFGGWIPMFHDMGLMGLLLPALFLGGTCILMPPPSFLKRAHAWLKMMDRFDIHFTAAPNFAYELCLQRITDDQIDGLDLSRWRWAANGSEPVQAETIRMFAQRFGRFGFASTSMCPCYGMAETTLFVSGTGNRVPRIVEIDEQALSEHRWVPRAGGRALVSCGHVKDYDVAIADPDSGKRLGPGAVGEVWLRGASVTQGYWQNEEATARVYGAVMDNEGGYFRTGDLGALHEGELVITGRAKEMLIVHGRNLYPQDLERELRTRHPELSGSVGAVFSVSAVSEQMVVTHEVRAELTQAALGDLAAGMKRTLLQEIGVHAAAVLLMAPGGVMRTTSGKIQRTGMRQAFLRGQLAPLYEALDPRFDAWRQALRQPEPA